MNKRFFNQQNLTRRLRMLPVLFAMLLMPIGAWAEDYPLIVAGVQVTDANKGNVLNDGETATVVFTPAGDTPATLTLYNATITRSVNDDGILYSGTEALIIKLKGSNTISCSGGGKAIRCTAATATPTLTIAKGDSNPCSLVLEAGSDGKTTDGFTVSPSGLYSYDDNTEEVRTTTYTTLGGGSGESADDPIIIKTKEDLRDFAKLVNNGTITNEYIKLNPEDEEGELDCNGLTGFEPIGICSNNPSDNHPFIGKFDGNNCTIKNLTYSTGLTPDRVGLFGYVGKEDVSDTKIEKLTLSSCSFNGGEYAGGIVGDMVNGTIENCVLSSCTVKSGDAHVPYAGGIAGKVENGTISTCTFNSGLVDCTTAYSGESSNGVHAGGIVGAIENYNSENLVTVSSCIVSSTNVKGVHSGAVYGPYKIYVGGLVGCSLGTVAISGNKVTTTDNTKKISCQSGVDYTEYLCGAIIGDKGDATLSNNTYEYDVTTEIAGTSKSGYTQRGVGGRVYNTDTQQYDPIPDVFTNNGAVMDTRLLAMPGESSPVTALGDEGGYYAYATGSTYGILGAPGKPVKVTIDPNGNTITDVSVTYGTDHTATITHTKTEEGIYFYTISEMPDADDATLNVTYSQVYDLWIAGIQVSDANATNVLGDGKVSFAKSVGVDTAPTYTLTLNGATIKPTTECAGIKYTGTTDLVISLNGTNNVVKGGGNCNAILYDGTGVTAPTLTFTNGGTAPCSLQLEAVGVDLTTIAGFASVVNTGLYRIDDTESLTKKTTITSLGGGSGTAADPIIIKTTDDLKNFSKLVNNGTINTAAMYFRLAPEGGTLDCSELDGFEPIGSGSQPFQGTFSGNGCTISNLIAYEGGLFGNISGATIEDLNLSNCTIAGNDYRIAGLATDASNGSTINLCTITNSTIECLSNQYDPTVGGIVARLSDNETTISNCVVNNTQIKAEATNSTGTSGIAGGIVGEATSGKIENCHIKGESKITDYNNAGATLYAGAIVGKYTGTTLSANYYYYDVTVETLKGTDTANKVAKDGYTQRALGNGDDVPENNGAVMNTRMLTLPAESSLGTVTGDEGGFYAYATGDTYGILGAPGKSVRVAVTPSAGFSISAINVTYGTGQTADIELTDTKEGASIYTISEMPDADNATLNVTYSQVYDLWIGGTQVSDANKDHILGEGNTTVTFAVTGNEAEGYVNTLTLNGAALTVPIKVGLANLTIDIQGANTITTDGTCIQNVATTGTPSLTFKSTSTPVGSLILTKGGDGRISDIGEGNITVSKELAVLLTVYETEDYTSRLYYITDGSTSVAKIVPSYGVSIIKDGSGKLDIYEGNADDVFGDGTVSFNNGTKILTLNGASRGAISTSLTTLTVELVGNNTLTESDAPVLCSSSGAAVTFNIQSTADVKGTLTMNRGTTAGNFNDGNVTVNITEPLAVISGSMTNATTAVIGVSCQLNVSFTASNEWATYYGTENLATPEGLKVYQVTAVDGSTVTIGEIGYIPANTAVLLKNVSNNNTWSNIAASAYTGATSTFASNKLIGTAEAVNVSDISGGTVYVLYNNMFKRASGGAIPANRGYLVVEPSAVNAGNAPQLSITIGDENTTAISNTDFTDNTDKAGEWYSIDGVKLNCQPQKPGLYIKNGKKVFINKK